MNDTQTELLDSLVQILDEYRQSEIERLDSAHRFGGEKHDRMMFYRNSFSRPMARESFPDTLRRIIQELAIEREARCVVTERFNDHLNCTVQPPVILTRP
jgi:hypothetical protein